MVVSHRSGSDSFPKRAPASAPVTAPIVSVSPPRLTAVTMASSALTADSAEDAIVTAVNRGGDTDTVGAVTGALAGARFGKDSLPDRWLDTIAYREDLELLGQVLATTEMEASV